MTATHHKQVQTVSFVSLGCPKNLVDSEKMFGLLAEAGLIPVDFDEEQPVDAVVVNTCGFIAAAREESLEQIRRIADLKRDGRVKKLIVAGCLTQRYGEQLLTWCPEIDALIGVFDRDRIVEAVNQPDHEPCFRGLSANAAEAGRRLGLAAHGYYEDDCGRLRLTPRHYAYLRISEGCNQQCAFCTIPAIRGQMRSKSPEIILHEAEELFQDGAVELILIGEDTTSYGKDIGVTGGLAYILQQLNRIAEQHGGKWLRLMYAYPSTFSEPLIDTIADLAHLVKYIDLPLQHINDGILSRMRRHTSRRQIESLLNQLRRRIPEIAVRTTFISGFPGETDQEHEELLAFIRDFRFEALGVFPFSAEEGTAAWSLQQSEHTASAEVVADRIDELMRSQFAIVSQYNQSLINRGAILPVLIDGHADSPYDDSKYPLHAELKYLLGRTPFQAPEIDGKVYIESESPLLPGEIISCRMVDSIDYDLVGRQPDSEMQTSGAAS